MKVNANTRESIRRDEHEQTLAALAHIERREQGYGSETSHIERRPQLEELRAEVSALRSRLDALPELIREIIALERERREQ